MGDASDTCQCPMVASLLMVHGITSLATKDGNKLRQMSEKSQYFKTLYFSSLLKFHLKAVTNEVDHEITFNVIFNYFISFSVNTATRTAWSPCRRLTSERSWSRSTPRCGLEDLGLVVTLATVTPDSRRGWNSRNLWPRKSAARNRFM